MGLNPYQSPQQGDAPEVPPHMRTFWGSVSLGCAVASTVVLVFALTNMAFTTNGDRYELRPYGALADWVFTIAVIGWILTAFAGLLGYVAKDREWNNKSKLLSNICLAIVTINVVVSAFLHFVIDEFFRSR